MENLKNSLIKLLCEDARYTVSQMSKMLGESEDKIAKAVSELEEDGVILKYTAIVNHHEQSNKVQAMIEVKVAPQKLNGFDSYAQEIYTFPEVQSLYLMSGGFDLAVFVEGDNLTALSRFVAEKLSVIDGIVGVQTHFILKKYKIEGVATEKEDADYRLSVQA